jgi:Uma2 family endonuclease
MSAILQPKMSVEEFLVWAEGRDGRFELDSGTVIAMAPERVLHAEVKHQVCVALWDAIRRAGLACRALPDGIAVRIDSSTAYEPDALVYCGSRLPVDGLECPNPVIVVEVLSPGTSYRDLGVKLTGYFTVASVQHYLIVDADRRVVFHHRRCEPGAMIVRILGEGELVLDPPGLTLSVESLLPPAPDALAAP